MRITKYKTELDQNKHNVLVKESAINYQLDCIFDPQSVVEMLNDCYGLNRLAEEHMYMISLSTKSKVLGVFELAHGTVDTALCNPREIFIRLLLTGASSFILAHNHPSGDVGPSNADIEITKRIIDSGNVMGIRLLDHIIVGDGFYSFKMNRIIE